MLRKTMLALTAIAALGLTATASTGEAHAKKGWHKGHGWHHKHKGWGWKHRHWHHGHGFRFYVPAVGPDCFKVYRYGRIRVVCSY